MLHSTCQQIWKTEQWPQDWKRSVFIPISKKGNAKECSNYHTIALISHTSKVMLKILQARLQQYVNCELPDVQTGFWKGRGTRDKIVNIPWIIEEAKEFQKNIYCFICYVKVFDCVDHNKLWKILQEMGIPDHLTCLLRNLYAGQETTVRTVWNMSRLYIVTLLIYMKSKTWDMLDWMKHKLESRLPKRNINNLRYADDTTLMAESEEELKSLLMKVKEESEKVGLNLNIEKTKIMASSLWHLVHHSMANRWRNMEPVTDFIFSVSKITAVGDCSHEIKRCLLLGRKAMTNLESILKSRLYFADKGPSNQSYGFSRSHVWMRGGL